MSIREKSRHAAKKRPAGTTFLLSTLLFQKTVTAVTNMLHQSKKSCRHIA